MKIRADFIGLLRCPVSGQGLIEVNGNLVTRDNKYKYRIDDFGIPLFAEQFCSPEAKVQEQHYDRISRQYLENLAYPHTLEYLTYLDNAFLEALPSRLGVVTELCCGSCEAFKLAGYRITRGIGVDVSTSMLQQARSSLSQDKFHFIQGDAVMLPLKDEAVDAVIMLGGVHHVPNRQQLFNEVFRVLKPDGVFIFREPVSDIFLWQWIRAIIYRISPMLDNETERPLRWAETVPLLGIAGLKLQSWKTHGLIGFCLFMNSDVLLVNKIFRYLPGIKYLVRLSAQLDKAILRFTLFKRCGLQVVGIAHKP
jgi:ubiquinone/menaquinone biosynthesis C-methylase UbiE